MVGVCVRGCKNGTKLKSLGVCVFGIVRTVQSLKASVCVCVWDCKNSTKLKSLGVCVFGIVRTVQSLAVCVQDF